MYSTTIGNTTQSSLKEHELKILWLGLKALEENGVPPKCVGTVEKDKLEKLIKDLKTACVQYLDSHGPISEHKIKQQIETSDARMAIYMRSDEYKERIKQIEESRKKEQEEKIADKHKQQLENSAMKYRTAYHPNRVYIEKNCYEQSKRQEDQNAWNETLTKWHKANNKRGKKK